MDYLAHFLCVVQSCPTLFDPVDYNLPGSSAHGDSPGKNARVGCHALPQGIFPTQASNPGLSHCRQILYRLSHQGSPRILEWVAYPFSRGSSQPRNWTRKTQTTAIITEKLRSLSAVTLHLEFRTHLRKRV